MTREEAIKKIKLEMAGQIIDKDVRDVLETLIPELAESEDERIRKFLIDILSSGVWKTEWPFSPVDCVAYLEKQKDLFESGRGLYYYDGEKTTYCGYPATEENPYDFAMSQQKEQKPAEIDEEHKVGKWFTGLIPCWIDAPSTLQPAHSYHGKNVIAIHEKSGGYRCCCVDDEKPTTFSVAEDTHLVEGWKDRKPAEWSDTNELVFKDICKHLKEEGYNGWIVLLNALRNGEFRPKQEWSEEDEKTIDTIVSVLSQYIDYKAVSGPSSGSAFATPRYSKEIDWLNSLHPSWKPSEQEKCALRTAIYVLTDERNFPKTAAQLQNILNAFEGEEPRKDWKPSEAQMAELNKVRTLNPGLDALYQQLKNM